LETLLETWSRLDTLEKGQIPACLFMICATPSFPKSPGDAPQADMFGLRLEVEKLTVSSTPELPDPSAR
jgi:hypothetical protein